MKVLVRMITFSVILVCLILISLEYMFVEVRKDEIQSATSIALRHTVDAWIEQNEQLDGLTIEEYVALLKNKSEATNTLTLITNPYDDPMARESYSFSTNKTIECTKEEHAHTQECYDESDILICGKEEHTHSETCTTNEERVIVEVITASVYNEDDKYKVVIENLDSDYEIISVEYFDKDYKMEAEQVADDTYLFETSDGIKEREIIINYQKKIDAEEYRNLKPLFFYTDDEFENYFKENLLIQTNSLKNITFETYQKNVNIGDLKINVTIEFEDIAGKTQTVTTTIDTYTKIYPSKSFLDPVISVQREGYSEKRKYIDILKGLGLVDDSGNYSDEMNYLINNPSNSVIEPVTDSPISATPWHYPESFGGTFHLGTDYASAKGTEILAPANAVIVVSSSGCDDGKLGNACAGDNVYAVGYGGNQVTLLFEIKNSTNVNIEDGIYAMTIFHMLDLDIHKEGVVDQGQVIGYVGTSGNSTGPHAHVEMWKLAGTWEQVLNREYSSSFNNGWGANAIANACEYHEDETLNDESFGACRLKACKVINDRCE